MPCHAMPMGHASGHAAAGRGARDLGQSAPAVLDALGVTCMGGAWPELAMAREVCAASAGAQPSAGRGGGCRWQTASNHGWNQKNDSTSSGERRVVDSRAPAKGSSGLMVSSRGEAGPARPQQSKRPEGRLVWVAGSRRRSGAAQRGGGRGHAWWWFSAPVT